jgi:hypothetical protein
MRKLFLSILKGESPRDAVPVVASQDEDLIRAVGRELARRLGVGETKDVSPPVGGEQADPNARIGHRSTEQDRRGPRVLRLEDE